MVYSLCYCVILPSPSHLPLRGLLLFVLQSVNVSVPLLQKILISSEQFLCSCTGLALQTLALKGQTYPLDPHALQLFLQHFFQDVAKLLQEVWVSPQSFQQPLLPALGGLLPAWSKGRWCWYQCNGALAVPWESGWWDPSPPCRHRPHQSQSKQLIALSKLHPSEKGQLSPLI